MPSTLDMTVLLCGVATFLLRWVPIHKARLLISLPPAVQRAFQAIGPAAISALLMVSLLPLLVSPSTAALSWGVPVALATVWGFKRRWGGIAAPTLFGALTYGVVAYLFA